MKPGIFLAVVRSRSPIAAERSLKVSAAPVARRIDALEKRLGARLFERRGMPFLREGCPYMKVSRPARFERVTFAFGESVLA
jgi:DNA-binding transcriptional LysR family regulator